MYVLKVLLCSKYNNVIGSTKIDHVSTNYKLYFANVFSCECGIPLLSSSEESTLNFAVVVKILCYQCIYLIVIQNKNLVNVKASMVKVMQRLTVIII